MSKTAATPSPAPNQRPEGWRYESAVAEIETIIDHIESGDLELEDVFDQFAKAVESLQWCEAFLGEHQSQVELLIETLGDPPSSVS